MIDNSINAVYGTFSLDMNPLVVLDVSQKIYDFKQGNNIVIPPGVNFNKLFEDTSSGKKYLQVSFDEKKFNILNDNYLNEIILSPQKQTKFIRIIYYIYIDVDTNWLSIISGQLYQLKSYGVLEESELYVHICDENNIIREVVSIIKKICKNAIISSSSKNQFEYLGIKLVYELAKLHPNDFIIYFHSKGMSYKEHSRSLDEIALFTATFENWRKNLQYFNNKKINKLGLFPAVGSNADNGNTGDRGGWIWFNFWYARASYLAKCEDPLQTNDRYYYESWLGKVNGQLLITNDCQSLFNKGGRIYFKPCQASNSLQQLVNETYLVKKNLIFKVTKRLKQYFHKIKL